jgi:hypothetical protein
MDMLIKEKAAYCERFDMDDRGEIHDFLGLLVRRDRENKIITISQSDFVENVLVRFGMKNCKPVSTPME